MTAPIEVTEEMIEVGKIVLISRLKRPEESDYVLVNGDIETVYRVMRALEPQSK